MCRRHGKGVAKNVQSAAYPYIPRLGAPFLLVQALLAPPVVCSVAHPGAFLISRYHLSIIRALALDLRGAVNHNLNGPIQVGRRMFYIGTVYDRSSYLEAAIGLRKALPLLILVGTSISSYTAEAAHRADYNAMRSAACHSSRRASCHERSHSRVRHVTVRHSSARNIRTYYTYDIGPSAPMHPAIREAEAPPAPMPSPPPPAPPAFNPPIQARPVPAPYGSFQSPTGGNVFNFYAPSTNYFGFAPQPLPAGPFAPRFDERTDPWHGYDGNNGLRNGY
jgi:hypothetical protein